MLSTGKGRYAYSSTVLHFRKVDISQKVGSTFAGARPLDTFDLVRFGRQLDTSPGVLMDIMEGCQELTFALADTIVRNFDTSAEWLLGGSGQPFPFVRLGSMGYREFFIPAGSNTDYTFEFLGIAGDRHPDHITSGCSG